MGRLFIIEITESEAVLKKRLQQSREAIHKGKLQMLWWFKSGQVKQHLEIAQRLGPNPSTITRWLQQYCQGGIEALLTIKKSPGRPREIDEQMLPQLEARLAQPEGFKSYGEIEQWVQSELGKAVKYKTVYKTVRYDLKAKLKVPRPKSRKQDPEAVKLFKKNIPLALLALQKLFGQGKRLRYVCQDEMRLGLKTETGRVITAYDVKPNLPVEWKRDNFWVYGVVEPLSG
ncbi:MAG: IS630 family transposase [Leptolyngbya sp. BL-A-14]